MKRLLALLAAFALVLAACGGGDDDAPDTDDALPPGTTNLEIAMTEFVFEPDSVTIPAGERIILDLQNEGGIEHNFVIMSSPISAEAEYDVANALLELTVQPGDGGLVEFTAPAAGTYQIICSISGHFTAGMVGELISS